MKVFKKLLLASLFVYLPLQSMAWGMLGHRIVGEIAHRHLSAKAKKNIQKILGNESMAIASNWPDFVKSDPSFDYLDTWHYVNLKEGLTRQQVETHLQQDTSTNAYTKINFLVTELKKDLTQEKKAQYLKILIHLIGDIHQPMHVGRPEDLGGNRIRVEWFNQPSNLHRLWDSQLIEYQQLSYTEYVMAIDHVTKSQSKIWQQEPMTQWFFESYQIADQLYKELKQPQEKLGYRYNFDHVQTLNERLLKGGVRLAGVLEEIFG